MSLIAAKGNAAEAGVVLRDKAGRPRKGEGNNPDNVRIDYGHSVTYALARLRRDRPDFGDFPPKCAEAFCGGITITDRKLKMKRVAVSTLPGR